MRRANVETKAAVEVVEAILAQEASKSQKIKALFDHGYDVKEISEMMTIRYNHAYNVIQNYVIVEDIEITKAERATSEKRADIEAMILDGAKNIEIARATKTTYNYIWKVKDDMKKSGQLIVEEPEVLKVIVEEPVKNNKSHKKDAKV